MRTDWMWVNTLASAHTHVKIFITQDADDLPRAARTNVTIWSNMKKTTTSWHILRIQFTRSTMCNIKISSNSFRFETLTNQAVYASLFLRQNHFIHIVVVRSIAFELGCVNFVLSLYVVVSVCVWRWWRGDVLSWNTTHFHPVCASENPFIHYVCELLVCGAVWETC